MATRHIVCMHVWAVVPCAATAWHLPPTVSAADASTMVTAPTNKRHGAVVNINSRSAQHGPQSAGTDTVVVHQPTLLGGAAVRECATMAAHSPPHVREVRCELDTARAIGLAPSHTGAGATGAITHDDHHDGHVRFPHLNARLVITATDPGD